MSGCHLLEMSKAVPFSQEEDVCSRVRSHLRSKLAGTQLHLMLQLGSISPKCENTHQAIELVLVSGVEELCSVVFISHLL